MSVILICTILFSAAISLALTPLVIKLAFVIGAVDYPDERKIHSRPMPRLGGLATFLGFAATLALARSVVPLPKIDGLLAETSGVVLCASMVSVLVVGVCDDVWSLKPGQKFLIQFLAGTMVYLAGFRVDSITDPFGRGVLELGLLSFPFTVLWVLGITNAFNLIDGLDGLAAGIAFIACLTVSAIALEHQHPTTAVIAMALAGSVLGFLRYNFNPAKVFLGDSGSLFLGFILAVLSIQSSTKGTAAFSLIVPLLALGVPIMDTLLAMVRRLLRSFARDENLPGSSFKKWHSMFLPDRRHIHHQLLARGHSQRQAVIILYVVASAFGLCAFLVTAGSLHSTVILLSMGIAAVIGVKKLGYSELAVIRNGLLLKFYKRAVINHGLTLVALDTCSVAGAFLLSHSLILQAGGDPVEWRTLTFSVLSVCILQLTTFVLGGLYRRAITLLSLSDMLHILKATAAGVAILWCASMILPLLPDAQNIGTFFVFDFYLLVTFICGSRFAFRAMDYVVHREPQGGRRALIYGADRNGLLALRTMLARGSSRPKNGHSLTPIGFLDDDPHMEGKFLDGYPVFGGHWKLERLVNREAVGEIILAGPTINAVALNRVRSIARARNLLIRVSHFQFTTIALEESPEEFVRTADLDGVRFVRGRI